MERKIGETFEYKGKTFKVAEAKGDICIGCFFNGRCFASDVAGECESEYRSDKKEVIFMEIQEQPHVQAEQPQKEQPQLNLCEILKNCPEGTELWSDNYGIVKFVNVSTEWDTPIRVKLTNGFVVCYTEEGWCDKRFPANCLLWPSRDCRDWSKFTAPWLKKERFDPKTLKPFDKIIFKGHGMWFCGLFSHIHNSYACVGETYYKCVIPYNDDTKRLLGTKDEAPDFYKYWED